MKEKIYYHYCSVDTFYNIIQTSTLRFGNPLSMNDSAEIIWLLEMVKEYVREKKKYIKIIDNWNLIETSAQVILQMMDLPYIFCLSKQNDVLSQWRSYADDGRGISLGIDVNILLKQSNKLKGNDIIYDKKEQINLLNEKIKDKVLDELEKAIDSKNENDIFNKSRILISHILNETVICKNPAFQEEKEYRVSCIPSAKREGNVSEIKFRTNNKSIIPYIEINFENIRHNLIKNITVGLKSSINNRNLWLFLNSQGFKWKELDREWTMDDTKWAEYVKVSEATYR